MVNAETLKREQLLFSYTAALEQGDFERLEHILELAGTDPILERQILEIHAALAQRPAESAAALSDRPPAENTWRTLKKFVAGLAARPMRLQPSMRAIGLFVVVGLLLTVGTLALLGPGIGRVFSNAVVALPASAYRSTPAGATRAPAPTAAPAATVQAAQNAYAYGTGSSAYPAPQVQQATAPARMIVRNATLSVVVKDSPAARQAVLAMMAEYAPEGAFVVSASESYAAGSELPVISMTLRVPVKRYDESMNRLAAMGTQVLTRRENAQDVTQAYVDVSARIEALQASRARLLVIIKEAKNTDDLLRAEQELSRREAELEAAKANQLYLEQTAALSSISLELHPAVTSQPVADSGWNPAATFHTAVQSLLLTLTHLADGSITFAITVLPWLVLLGLLAFAMIRWLWRQQKK